MKFSKIAVACSLAFSFVLTSPIHAQEVTATTSSQITLKNGGSPAALKRKLKETLELKALRNLLEASFAVKITPSVEQNLPQLVELLTDSFQFKFAPSDGEVLEGSATITVPTAKLKEYLTNKGIGAGDIAASSAKILVSIDEFIGVATTNDGQKAVETETNYSHDKSAFSDTSAKASGSKSRSASAASYDKTDVTSASRDAVAVSGRQSSSEANRQASSEAGRHDAAYAGRSDTAAAYQGSDGSAAAASRTKVAGASSSQYAAAQSSQHAAAQSSQFAGAASSESSFSDKSVKADARSASSASSFSSNQKNVQQQNDKVSISVRTRMPEFNNAKPLGEGDRVLASRLSGEFQNNGLKLVAENDLRAEGGKILPIFTITNNGRINQFVDLIHRKNIEADVWATGQANYTIVGTTPSGTQCNGNLSVQGRFLEGNEIFFEDSLQAAAVGNGDQDCRARLGIALASSLAKTLGDRANKALNARNSRGSVYTLYLYSTSALKRSDRRNFTDALGKIDGLQASEPTSKENYIAINVQYSGKLKSSIDNMLDNLAWDNATVLDKANKICVGIEGASACPAEFR